MKKVTTRSAAFLFKTCFILLFAFVTTNKAEASVCDAVFLHFTTSNPDSIVFQHTGASVGFYHWEFGDGDTSNLQDPTHVFAGPGTYTVCLFIRQVPNNDTCSFCDTVIVPPTTCWATFSWYANPNNADSIHFYSDTTGATSYQWTFGDGDSSNLQAPWHEYPGPGTYTVCLTTTYSTFTCTSCNTVTITSTSTCDASFVHYNIGNPDSVHFYPTTTSAVSYLWTFGDSTSSTLLNPWHVFPGAGTYTVCLVLHTSTDSCYSCDTVVVPQPASTCDASFVHYNIGNPDSIHFYPTSTNALGYYWSFGDNTYSSTLNPWHLYPGPGTYTSCLTIFYSNDTCTWCDTIVVPQNTTCDAQFGHYSNSNNPDSVHFYGTGTGVTSWYWTFSDNTTATGQYPWHEFPGPGTYTVCLTAVYSSDSCSWCDTVIVPSTSTCNAQFSHYNIGNPDSVHFYFNSTGATGWYWTFGDNTSSTQQYPWHVYPGPGTYTTCLTLFYPNDTCTWCDTVIVSGMPQCHAEFAYYTMSNPDSIHFYPTYSGAVGYLWTFGDGDTSSLQYPWHEYTSSGTYYVCLTAYFSADTCTWCDSVTIGNAVCNTHFSHYSLNNPDSVHFYPTGNAANSYYWDFGDGNTSTLQYPWHYYATPGTYYVCLTAAYSTYTCSWCDTITITIVTTCNAQFNFYSISNPDSVHFYPTTTGALSYYWTFGDGDSSNLQYPWHEYAGSGPYYVCLTAQYPSGYCTWCDSLEADSNNVFHHMANNPTLDRFVFDVNAVSVSELTAANNGISIYPNPVNEYLNVSVQHNAGTVDLRIFDANSRLVYNKSLREGNHLLSVKNLAEGFYFFTAVSDGKVIGKGKILVVR